MCFIRNCNVLTKNVVGASTCVVCTCVVFFRNQTAGPVKVLQLVNLIKRTKPNKSSFAHPRLLSAGECNKNSGGVWMTFVNNINEIEAYNIPQDYYLYTRVVKLQLFCKESMRIHKNNRDREEIVSL